MTVVCLTGTPKTGKTTIANVLGRRLRWSVLHLNDIAKERGYYEGMDSARGVPVVALEKLEKDVRALKGNVIMESHYAHDLPSDVVFVLRTNPGVLRKRMQAAGWPPEKIEENIEAEIMEICLSEAKDQGHRVHEIDTSSASPDAVATMLVRILQDEKII